ncbi:ComF family protein [Peptoniphilus catoniae]|uniref:ComF family protein n=1 Tax=Peptoniphilus catoniae TaxID=1660341 RepID=UPI0010FF0F7C|nr:phosphoribosyltransferase family protein [Peptoniphilus catoniae]
MKAIKERCLFCDDINVYSYGLCRSCFENLNFDSHFPFKLSNLDRIVVGVEYVGMIRKIISDFKFRDKVYYYKLFSEILTEKLFAESLSKDYKQITYVPMHIKDLKKRGYNQSKLIAQGICDNTLMDLIEPARKIKLTKEQVKTESTEERLTNIKGAFKGTEPLSGGIIIVDDVITTGATVNELAGVLKSMGAKKVAALVAASPQNL